MNNGLNDETVNRIGDSGAQHLSEALGLNRALKKLCLLGLFMGDTLFLTLFTHNLITDTGIEDAGAMALAESLHINSVLDTLELGGMSLFLVSCSWPS